MKKPWCEPRLVVLVRTEPEEAVLSPCKAAQQLGGPQISDVTCHVIAPACSSCLTLAAS